MAGRGRLTGPQPWTGGGGSLEEFKARLPLAEIIGRYVKLTRRGREWTGLCPFHAEKTPSFTVVEDKGFYHCFGCGAHGDAMTFMMAIERLEFPEAIDRLAELSGIPAPRRVGPEPRRIDLTLVDANRAAAVWYAARLLDPEAAAARAYLERRGLDRDSVRDFRLGWAPADRAALRRALEAQGFTAEQLVAAGLLRLPEGGGEPYALLRERVVFPIADSRGRIVGFGGRTLGDGQPKYLNTPDTELFHKGRLLYGLDRAAEAARRSGRLVVAEGYMDVIALVRAGFPAVAPLGTAMGEEQLERCWRLVDRPTICLDSDTAGIRAALRLAERAAPLLRPDRSLSFVLLPEGEDPDSLLRNHGAAALAEALAAPEPLASFVYRVLRAGRGARLERMEERASLRRSLREFAAKVGDPDVRASLAEEFQALLEAELARLGLDRRRPLRSGWAPAGRQPPSRPPLAAAPGELVSGIGRLESWREAPILAPILADPGLLAEVEDELAELELENPELERLRQEVLQVWSQAHHLDAPGLAAHLAACGLAEPVARVRQACGTGGEAGAEVDTVSPRERWRETVSRLRRCKSVRRELDALLHRPDVSQAERPLAGLDRLLNERDEDAAGEAPRLSSRHPDS